MILMSLPKMPIASSVFRGLKRGWVDLEGNIQLVAYYRRIKVPPSNEPERGLSVSPEDTFDSVDSFVSQCKFACFGAAKLLTEDVEKVRGGANGTLSVEIDSPTHATIVGLPFPEHNKSAAVIIAANLIKCSSVERKSLEKLN